MAGHPAALSPDNALVLKVWSFCEGWNPDRLPIALAYFEVEDVDLMVSQLLALNDLMAERRNKGG
jgi:hypothetical protein